MPCRYNQSCIVLGLIVTNYSHLRHNIFSIFCWLHGLWVILRPTQITFVDGDFLDRHFLPFVMNRTFIPTIFSTIDADMPTVLGTIIPCPRNGITVIHGRFAAIPCFKKTFGFKGFVQGVEPVLFHDLTLCVGVGRLYNKKGVP